MVSVRLSTCLWEWRRAIPRKVGNARRRPRDPRRAFLHVCKQRGMGAAGPKPHSQGDHSPACSFRGSTRHGPTQDTFRFGLVNPQAVSPPTSKSLIPFSHAHTSFPFGPPVLTSHIGETKNPDSPANRGQPDAFKPLGHEHRGHGAPFSIRRQHLHRGLLEPTCHYFNTTMHCKKQSAITRPCSVGSLRSGGYLHPTPEKNLVCKVDLNPVL